MVYSLTCTNENGTNCDGVSETSFPETNDLLVSNSIESGDIQTYKLTIKYNENDYPIYDNYNVIEVNKTKNIPYDYDGIMGVPITFLYKYNPNQFEIIGLSYSWDNSPIMESIRTDQSNRNNAKLNGKLVYTRVFIKNKTPLIN
jgi:hypothetical protein